jgi:ubiquinone/menaquinone biosynthesis C-methylase UbiE
MSEVHPMMPAPTHDERSEQYFVRDLKRYLAGLGGAQKQIALELAAQLPNLATPDALESAVMAQDVFRDWTRFRRAAQEMMWDAIASSVDRQIDQLEVLADIAAPIGSLQLDPALVPPDYLRRIDVHLMPGGYLADRGSRDVRQGAVMDRGGAVYLLGRNGGLMNDGRGHALISHVFDRAPDFEPARTIELGCGVGASAMAVAGYFPGAGNFGIDVGAALLRYAHARAEHMGVPMHFAQRNAEQTGFPDDHFDLVYSCAVLHETSPEAVNAIIAESRRILRPGGLMVHLEVPSRIDADDPWARIEALFEQRFNNEPYWTGANTLDYEAALRQAGFLDVMVGYQATRGQAERGNRGFSLVSSGAFACWFVVSGVK